MTSGTTPGQLRGFGRIAASCYRRSNAHDCLRIRTLQDLRLALPGAQKVNLDIRRGEIFALLGPNGAGKTTLISIICGIVTAGEGSVRVDGHDIVADYRAARAMIGLVPQELTTDAFESVGGTVSFSRGLFGKLALDLGRGVTSSNSSHVQRAGISTMTLIAC